MRKHRMGKHRNEGNNEKNNENEKRKVGI